MDDKLIAFLRELVLDQNTPKSSREKALNHLLDASVGNPLQPPYRIFGKAITTFFDLTKERHNYIDVLLGSNQKIAAIKEIRRITNWDLLDSKTAAEDPRSFTSVKQTVKLW